MPELTGTIIERYRLLRRIAYGGMSEVYLASDRKTAQDVAIKLVRISEDDYRVRFQQEVKAISALQHEHILPALDYGQYESWLYLVTPYIAQGTLAERLAAGPLSYNETNKILQQLAGALQFAHEHGIIHRDIKPSNILLAEGMHAYLADFGLVKSKSADQSPTQSGLLVGTPAYMAPEMMNGPATPACDIYALGVLLYQMLTGQLPFQADTPLAVVWKHLHEEPVPPSTLNPALSPAIDDVILRALEKDPAKRFGTPGELAVAYQNALDRTVDAATVPVPQLYANATEITAVVAAPTTATAQKKKRATLLVAGLCAILCSALLVFGIFAYGLQYQPSSSSNTPTRPTVVSTSPPQAKPPATGPHGRQAHTGNPPPRPPKHGDNHDHGDDHGQGDN